MDLRESKAAVAARIFMPLNIRQFLLSKVSLRPLLHFAFRDCQSGITI